MVWGHGGVSEGAKPARTAVEACLKCRETNLVQSQPCCFLDTAAATSCFTNWLGSISESSNGHRPNQSENVLLFRQHGQSESQLSRMLCVILLQIFNQCSQVCTIPHLSTSHPWNMACLGRERGVSSHLLILHIWVLPILTESYHYC